MSLYCAACSNSTSFYSILVHSQLGPQDCMATLILAFNGVTLNVPPGTVCIQCVFGSVVATDATFQIDNADIDLSDGRIVNGVLVVFDTTSVFNTVSPRAISCSSAQGTQAGIAFLMSKSYWLVCMHKALEL